MGNYCFHCGACWCLLSGSFCYCEQFLVRRVYGGLLWVFLWVGVIENCLCHMVLVSVFWVGLSVSAVHRVMRG